MHAISKRINPINFSYTENLNKTGVGVLGDVPFSYRIGLKKYHGLDHSEQVELIQVILTIRRIFLFDLELAYLVRFHFLLIMLKIYQPIYVDQDCSKDR